MSAYVQSVLANLQKTYPWEKEFLQSVEGVLKSAALLVEQNPKYAKAKILERLVEPERTISFRVTWVDDKGEVQVNRGYRVQFNNALGPYKGGLRFHPTVTLSILKFLGFEQIFKNALTGLPLGGAKGGSDFDPHGRSDGEVMRFCQAFMTELYRHIGANIDVPAGDIGVGGREVGFLYGQYKKLTALFEGVLTGKGHTWGGSLIRPEATGYGLIYMAQEVLAAQGEDLAGKTVTVSGFGNVAWGTIKKAASLGAKCVTISGRDGFVYDPDGITGEKVDYLLEMRSSGRDHVADYADKYHVKFFPGKRPWGIKCDVALPCATQNEIEEEDAKNLVKNGCRYVIEGSNLSSSLEAIKIYQDNKIFYVPGKASNAGGVACSGLEMAQDSVRLYWEADDVEQRLHKIMRTIHQTMVDTAASFKRPYDYLLGANIAGLKKVADAMLDQGIV